MDQPGDASWTIGGRWVWILEIIFGGIVALAFERLDATLRDCKNLTDILKHVAVAICLFAFFLYDLGVYHHLVGIYPYRKSVLSVFRYSLDIVMAFLLMFVLMSGLRTEPEKSTVVLLIAITLWHLGAMLWHFLASRDLEKKLPSKMQFRTHLLAVCSYWILVGVWYTIARSWFSVDWSELSLLIPVCAAILVVAILRSRELVRAQEVSAATIPDDVGVLESKR